MTNDDNYTLEVNLSIGYDVIMIKDYYSVKEFAAKLGVSPRTIRRAISNGRISVIRVGETERSAIRISHSEIERIAVVELRTIIKKMVKDGKII